MNRQREQFPPASQPNKYYQTTTNSYPDYGYPPSESRKLQDSDLVIFNGGLPQKNIYQITPQKQQSTQQQTNITKSSSQKAFPIIYNSFNENRMEAEPKLANNRYPIYTREVPQSFRLTNQQAFEPSHSDVYQYGQSNTKKQNEDIERHQFHTFKYIPAESQPPTAHFLQLPSHNSDTYNQHRQELQPKKIPFAYQQHHQLTSLPIHVLPQHEDRNLVANSQQNQQGIRPSSRIFGSSIPPSPRLVERVQQNVVQITQQRPNFIQISNQEYQRYQEHMHTCRTNQQQLNSLRLKNQELSSKQRFYWQENATLRQENTRLRDLVSHFEKREQELLRQRQQLRSSLSQNINKYQQSTLQEVGLLLERYRLQLQKKK